VPCGAPRTKTAPAKLAAPTKNATVAGLNCLKLMPMIAFDLKKMMPRLPRYISLIGLCHDLRHDLTQCNPE